ncbi:MAG TPA: response regulator [Candidatus Limnocylindria bacterium]|nr:response regulator [Candidatus Limnocylindria bacterium]
MRILAIEDEALWTELLGRALTRAGFDAQIERVMSEEELRSALDHGRWDIVVSDNRMPRFSAKEALAMVRARDRAVPFIVVSGYLTEAQRAELEAGGASQFVEKGDLPRLVVAVRIALAADHPE